jgi:hypothetical protein
VRRRDRHDDDRGGQQAAEPGKAAAQHPVQHSSG